MVTAPNIFLTAQLISLDMSSKHEDTYGGGVDYDFFDSPRTNESSQNISRGRKKASCTDSILPTRTNGHSDTSSDSSCVYSSDDSVGSKTPSSSSGKCWKKRKNVRKIEARLPSAHPFSGTKTLPLSDDNSEHNENDYDNEKQPKQYPRHVDTKHIEGKHSSMEKKSEGMVNTNYRSAYGREQRDTNSCSNSDSETSSSETSTGSDVTDVSPLNSPRTPYVSSLLEHGSHSEKSPKDLKHRPYSASSSASTNRDPLLMANKDSIDMKLLMQAILEMEQSKTTEGSKSMRGQSVLYARAPGPRAVPRKNFSFDNDKVRTIDRENQRLMQNILKHAKEAKKMKKKTKIIKSGPVKPTRLTTSAINRRREQDRIEQENSAFLKRLQTTKASKEVQKDTLLEDFNKTMYGYSFASSRPKNRSGSGSSLYDREGTVATSFKDDTIGHETHGSASSMTQIRPQSAKVIMRPHSANHRPASGKRRPTSATTANYSSKKFVSKQAWESGW